MVKINDNCISCGTCTHIAESLFELDNQTFKINVKKQPETDQEKADCESAKASCPVGAIED